MNNGVELIDIEDTIKILNNLKGVNLYQDLNGRKKTLETKILKNFQKNLLKLDAKEFRDIVNLMIDYEYNNMNFISKSNKYYSNLENSAENRVIKNNRFLLKMIELNSLAPNKYQLKKVEEYLSRLTKEEKIKNWRISDCVKFLFIFFF